MEGDAEVAENGVQLGRDFLDKNEAHNSGTIRPILQDSYLSGASFSQLFFWNRVLFASSTLLCVSQCLVSGLLLSNSYDADWPGNDLYLFDLWLPELFGGLLGLVVMFYCRLLLLRAKESAIRAQKSATQSSQRLYIPWSGVSSTAKSRLLWMLIVPAIVSWVLFAISAVSFALSVQAVKRLAGHQDYPNSGHTVAVVLLCLHLLILLCKILVLVLAFVIPVVILILVAGAKASGSWLFFTKRIYPFVVYLDVNQNARPLLIEL